MKDNIAYTGVILSAASVADLKDRMRPHIPAGWEVVCHHLTVNLGAAAKGPASQLLNQPATLKVVAVGFSDKAIAVKVQTSVDSINTTKHITVAVNRAGGGKPFDSNKIEKWDDISHFELEGTVQEVSR